MEQQRENYELVYSEYPPYEVISTKWMNFEEILSLKSVEKVVEIYYNSGQFVTIMAYVERYFNHAFAMYENLGEFYTTYFAIGEKHSRISGYECLLAFLNWHLETVLDMDEELLNKELEICKELLRYDIYLRENIKTRPGFFPKLDSTLYNDYYRQAKKEGKQIHIEHFSYDVEQFARDVSQGGDSCRILSGPEQKEIDVVFDYQNRDAIHYGAYTERIEF